MGSEMCIRDSLILEKAEEEKVFRAKKSVMEANRDKRNKSAAGDHHSVKREELTLDKTETGLLIKIYM